MAREQYIKKERLSQNGFTIIELAVVLVITGIMFSLFISAFLMQIERNKILVTKSRIAQIHESLNEYLRVNGRYPCPASRMQDPANPNFGQEVTTTCNTGAFAGTVRNGGVRIGAVPNKTLNLPDEFSFDLWDHRLTYAVTENLATKISDVSQYTADGGLISVIDDAVPPNPIGSPPNSGHFVVVSHGESGGGSYNLEGNLFAACPGAATLDGENCDDDLVFRSTMVNSDVNAAAFFDDYIQFKGQTEPVFIIPVGTVMTFNLDVCPNGWQAYNLAEGRFVVGVDSTPSAEQIYNLDAGVSPQPPAQKIFTRGYSEAQDDIALFPPYVALLHCEKI